MTCERSESGEGWTLYQGDCLDILPVLDLRVDLVLADPPYGIDCTKAGADIVGRFGFTKHENFTRKGASKIDGDSKPDGRWLAPAASLLRPGGVLYSFSRWDVDRDWHTLIEGAGLLPKNRIVWAKVNWGSGDLTGAFGYQHETLWRASKGQPDDLRIARCGDVWTDLWKECVRHGKTHPFEKPVDLLAKAINADSDRYGFVLDPFAGSASVGVAALRNARRYVGIEKDPHWFDEACARLRAEEQQTTVHAMRAGQLGLLGGVK